MISSDDLIALITQNTSGEGDKTESHKMLDLVSQRVDSLPIFYEVIQKCPISSLHLFQSFKSMKRIVEKRGCLMTPEMLVSHYGFIFQFSADSAQFLSSNMTVLVAASDAAAIVFRHLFEQQCFENVHQILDQLSSFLDATRYNCIVALSFFKSFIDIFNRSYYRMDRTKENMMKREFKDGYLPNFIGIVMKVVCARPEETDAASLNDDINMKVLSLELFTACCMFSDDANSDSLQPISYSESYSDLFNGTDALEGLFGLFELNNQRINAAAFRVFDYFLRATYTSWASLEAESAFFAYVVERISPIIIEIPPDCNYLNEATRTVAIICNSIRNDENGINESWVAFADACAKFTANVFTAKQSDNFSNIVKIWQAVAFWKLPEECIPTFAELLFNVLQTFVGAFFQQAEEDPEDTLERIRVLQSSDLSMFWSIAKYCFAEFGELIETKLEEKKVESYTSGSQAVLLEIIYLIKIVDAEREGKKAIVSENKTINFHEVEAKLTTKIAELVAETNEYIAPFAENFGIFEIELEQCLVEYASNFYKYNVLPLISKGAVNLSEYDTAQLEILQVHLTRAITNLQLFNTVQESGRVMVSILNFFDEVVKNPVTKEVLSGNEVIAALYSRSIVIEFDQIDAESFVQARTKLYSLYASLIPDRKEYLTFLSLFDERFTAIASNTTEDLSKDTIALYSDLTGVIQSIAKNSSFNSLFVRWFSETHIEEIITIIGQYASVFDVVSSITCLWKAIYTSFKDIMKGTGLGIEMFRASSAIVQAVYECCVENSALIPLLTKIICYSLLSDTANFGVMRHYGDNSFGEILASFFEIIKISYSEIALNEELCSDILDILEYITRENSDEMFTEENGENRMNIINFTKNSLANFDEDRSKSTWSKTWRIVKYMLTTTISTVPAEIELYRPHFVFVLDVIINANVTFTFESAQLIHLMANNDSEFASAAFQALIASYDPQFQQPVNAALQEFASQEDYKKAASVLHQTMRLYPTSFIFNDFFAQFYQTE